MLVRENKICKRKCLKGGNCICSFHFFNLVIEGIIIYVFRVNTYKKGEKMT